MRSMEERQALRAAWAAWALLLLITAAIMAADNTRSVLINAREAAHDWFAGRSLYNFSGIGGFVYLPQSALLFVPFAFLPVALSEALWRLVSIGTFALGLRAFASLAGGKERRDLFPLMTLVSIPLVWDCARNGQATLGMTGLMLLAVVDIARSRWRRAALWLTLGFAFKPIIAPLILLAAAIHRSLRWKLAAGMAVFLLAPFLMQRPSYVLEQYAGFMRNSAIAAHMGVAVQGWAHPFSALRVAGLIVPETVQTVIRLAAALATLALCFQARRRLDPARSAVYLFSLAAAYILLFSPRTENNTYMMLAPSIALFLASSLLVPATRRTGILLAVLALAMVGGRVIQRIAAPQAEAVWLSPLLATVFTAYLLVRFAGERDRRTAGRDAP